MFVLLSIESVLLIVLLTQLPVEKVDEELGHEVRVVYTILPQLLFLLSRQNEELKGPLEQFLLQPVNLRLPTNVQVDEPTREKFALFYILHHVSNNVSLSQTSIPIEAYFALVVIYDLEKQWLELIVVPPLDIVLLARVNVLELDMLGLANHFTFLTFPNSHAFALGVIVMSD